MPANPDPPDAPAVDSAAPSPPSPSTPPESPPTPRLWCLSLDRIGFSQAIGGFILGLIALFSAYDHITLAGTSIGLQRQWGILFIAASVATVVVDAQLATRSRLRAARERQVGRDRADQDRDRAAEARERQRKSFERLGQAALLSGRVQLDPNPTNRARFQFFLTLLAQSSLEEPDA
ncbi:MAG: hypothetical protein ACK5R2_07760 [Cyanobacteriota bacterium]